MKFASIRDAICLVAVFLSATTVASQIKPLKPNAKLYPLTAVRLSQSPFLLAADANLKYLLAHDPDRLLAPFRREAGLKPRKPAYGNWESMGLDGHTAGHYLSALADMIAAGHDTPNHELKRRLASMIHELGECQQASSDGYIGGVPDGKHFWEEVRKGHIEAFNQKWVPWYNVHKTFAGLRDAYLVAGVNDAKPILIRLADWAGSILDRLSDDQIQQMLVHEHGGMAEALAEVSEISGNERYLELAKRFEHHAILDPLEQRQDHLTGLHANTQIPKIIGYDRIAALTGDRVEDGAAQFFWETVTRNRTVAFGGNSVSEHFNDPKDFRGMLEHREGPETCNTYNMLRLTEQLFTVQPKAEYADYYERALYNHLLASVHLDPPGFVYFTPIRPGHYRVYSQAEQCFWCCVGTGMENPGRYGQFIYAQAPDGIYVNLFIPSELKDSERGIQLVQETAFPESEHSKITVHSDHPSEFALYIRRPSWASGNQFELKVNGKWISDHGDPSSYISVKRVWHNGDQIEVHLPMHTTVEGLPDGSNWYAILRGPIVLAAPTSKKDLEGLRAGPGRGDHVASGPMVPMDKMPTLLTTSADLPSHLHSEGKASALDVKLTATAVPPIPHGIELVPFYRLQDSRYQMYWEVTDTAGIEARKAKLAEQERLKLERDAATVDSVAVGEQQPEVDHSLTGEGMESGWFSGHRWRHGKWFQYTLNSRGHQDIELEVTYHGGDAGRKFGVYANGELLSIEEFKGDKPGQFIPKRYPLSEAVFQKAQHGQITIKFAADQWVAGGVYDVRLMRMAHKQLLK